MNAPPSACSSLDVDMRTKWHTWLGHLLYNLQRRLKSGFVKFTLILFTAKADVPDPKAMSDVRRMVHSFPEAEKSSALDKLVGMVDMLSRPKK